VHREIETAFYANRDDQVTLGVLKLAKEYDIPAIWLQPGAHDDAVVEYVKEHLSDRVIYGGPCVLVEGDDLRANL
jgi:predicted CoA-binding protein